MADRFTYTQVQEYVTALVPQRASELQKMEAYAEKNGFPIIGPAAGQLCYQLARLIGAQRVFELGSGYGYSTAWFARAVQENANGDSGGVVHHTVWDEKLSQMARQHLGALGYAGLVQYHVAEAVATLRATPGPFDLIFNDIDKEGYPDSLPVIAEKLRPGGLLIIDNMLSGGRIFDESYSSASLTGIREFTRLVTTSPDWIVTLAPIRDGLIVAQKV
ncbi:MAG: O-methyltransferase [Caldilineaceae bacterium]